MSWRLCTRILAGTTAAVLLSGCLARGGRGLTVSSVRSSYSPVVSFNAAVRISDSVRVQIERVRVLAPGETFEGMGPVTGRVDMQALIVTANPDADLSRAVIDGLDGSDRNGTRKPWVELAAGQSVRLADSLMMGVEQRTGPVVFTIPVPSDTRPASSWLVFRITGAAISMPARLADGSVAPLFELPPIRVFACATKNLDGKTDAARQRVMKEMYSAGC